MGELKIFEVDNDLMILSSYIMYKYLYKHVNMLRYGSLISTGVCM